MSRYDALVDACHKRARPILMTTTAFGLGAEPRFHQPMAVVVIDALITSTALSRKK